jgi:signal transduction histidine kinase
MAAYARADGIAPFLRVILTAFLAVCIIGAIFLMTNLYVVAGSAKHSLYAAVTDVCVQRMAHATSDAATAAAIGEVRAQFGVEGMTVIDGARVFTAGTTDPQATYRERRRLGSRTIEVRFTDHAMQKLIRTGRIIFAAAAAATVGGVMVFLSALFSVSKESEGGVAGNASVFETSVRTLRGREDALKEMHSREKERADALATITETLVRSLTSGFISVDERGLVLDLNQAAREILGVTGPGPFRDRQVADVLGETEFARVLQAASDGRATLQRVEVARDDGRIIGLTTVPLLDPTRRYLGMLALFTDLTHLRQLEMRLRDMQSLADLGEMSAGIAHEFRNSLSTVLGYLRLARKSTLPAEAEERIRSAETEAALLTEAVESLLTFARPMTLQTRPLDISHIITDIADRQRPLSGSITIDVEGGPLVVDADASLLARAFENLIRNATEAIQERGGAGRITVTIATAPHSVTVTDDGIGIDEAEASRLFLPFRSTKPNGFGLGLALTRKIVILHGGTIRMTGRRGEGTTVTVDLPPAERRRVQGEE